MSWRKTPGRLEKSGREACSEADGTRFAVYNIFENGKVII